MARLNGGTRVRKGYYFDMRGWAFHPVARDGEPLPGTSEQVYFRAPLPVVLGIAPLMGAAFLIFLPFIGFYLALGAALRPAARLLGRSATEMAATVRPGWQPGEAHLTGRRAEGGGAEEGKGAGAEGGGAEEGKSAGVDGEMAQLEREIAAKRQAERERKH